MLNWPEILLRRLVLAVSAVALAGCGQTGALYLPGSPGAANRATLPQTLRLAPRASSASEASTPPSQPETTP